ncbi:hypothetical protein [Streptomyces californicus]|uniref:hypothetical protein n=1 Tax=Streptomyces californicus TaxID=67351 RepID=UPI00365DCA2D
MTGILITAVLFLRALRTMFLGHPRLPQTIPTGGITDLRTSEAVPTVTLMAVALVIGVAPRWLLDVIEPASRTVTGLVAR